SERQCVDVIKRHIVGRRGMLISHNLDIVRELSEEIIVLCDGRIESRGNHQALLDDSPLYRRLLEKWDV
ncbi:MAG: ABC transporter ATP-binding protein, partial [Oscillospiraceae bacterium]|nr:ABC transporter ATP-binding protein [Oscillospiraceae bacterium]